MNYLGGKNDNIHINDTFIQDGSLYVDGDLLVGGELTVNDLQVNELSVDGYTLPTTKGNAGDIIVATTDGSTSEWQPAFEGNARIWQNMFTMTVPEPARKTTITRLDQSGIGSRRLERDQFPVGSAVRAYAKGQFTVTNPVLGQNASFKIYLGLQINTEIGQEFNQFVWGGDVTKNTVSFFQPFTGGHWEVEFYFTRISETEIQVNSTSINVYDIVGNPLIPTTLGASFYNIADVPPIPELPFIFPVDPSDEYFIFGIRQLDASSQNATCILKTEVYTIDLCSSESKVIASSANLTTDHTLLSNLTLGDAGHTQFALLAGRDGGQIISGGVTPLHDLKLKSHSIGLDNVIIKDLNTEFKKDVDMDNNNISNANLISNTDGSIQYNTPSYGLEITTQNNKNLNIVSALDAKITATNILDVAAGSVINLYNGVATQMTIDGSEIGANIPVNMNSNNITNAKDIIDASTNNKIDMNDPSLIGGMSIKSNTVGVLIQENSSTNNLGVTSGSVGMVCNSGQLNIRNTDAANNLTIAKQNGGDINLDVQTGGGVVKVNNSNLDMNNNSIVNASNIGVLTINNLTPVGGLSSGTSNSATLSGSTAEQSILALSFVGSRQAPANTFKQGDAYTAVLAGTFSSNNGDTLTIRLKGGPAGTTVLSSVTVPLNNSSGQFFELEIDFVVRQIGAVGVADLAINYDFSYNQSIGGNFQGQRKCEFNNTTFDTTILNSLDITAEFSSTSGNNSITTILSTLGKTY